MSALTTTLLALAVAGSGAPGSPALRKAEVRLADGHAIRALVHAQDLSEGLPAVRVAPRLARGAFWSFGDTLQRTLFFGCTGEARPELTGGVLACPSGSEPRLRPDVTLPEDTSVHPTSHVPPVVPGGRPVVQSAHFLAPWLVPCAIALVLLLGAAALLERRARRGRFPGPLAEPSVALDRRGWIALLLLCVAGLAVRLVNLGYEPFEQNEFTYFMSGMGHDGPFGVLLDVNAMAQTHPPLHHLALLALRPLGNDEVVARLPAVLAGAAVVPVIFLLGWRLFSGRLVPATFAGLLATLSPVQIWYSQDVSPYTAMTLFAALALLSGHGILRGPVRRGPWIGLVASSWGLVYTHYYGLHLSFAIFVVLLGWAARSNVGERSALLQRTLAAGCLLWAGIVPWIPAFAQAYLWSRGHSTEYQRLAGVYLSDTSLSADLLDALRLAAGYPYAWRWAALAGLALGLTHVRRLPLRAGPLWLLLAPLAWFVPFELVNRASFLHKLYGGYYFGIRYFLFLFPVGWLMAAACVDAALVHRRLRALTLAFAGGSALLAVVYSATLLNAADKPDIRRATALVAEHLEDGDAVIVGPAAFYQHPFHYYMADPSARTDLRINDFMQTPAWHDLAHRGGPAWLGALSGLFEPYERTLRSPHIRRVWVIDHTQHLFDRREFSDRPSEAITSAVRVEFEEVFASHAYHDTSVRLFERRRVDAALATRTLHFGWNDGPYVRRFHPPAAYAAPGRWVRPGAEVHLPLPPDQTPLRLRLRAGTIPPGGHQHVDVPAPMDTALTVLLDGHPLRRLTLGAGFSEHTLALPPLPAGGALRLSFHLDRPAPSAQRPPEVVLDRLEVESR